MSAVLVEPFVEGGCRASTSQRSFEVFNPSTGKPLPPIPEGSDADVDSAVKSARRAFDDSRWIDAPLSVRKNALFGLADRIAREASALDALDAEEMGKPVSEPLFSAAAAAGLMRFYAEAMDKVTGDAYRSDKGSVISQQRVPRGVVAAIVPWNFPTFNAVLKFAPALAAGNCLVLKPSELSSRSALRLAQLAVEAGVPPGVFNVVPGRGETVGQALGLHADVDMLAFTGSTATGKRMLHYAAQSNMKVVMAECGGKSPHIVFDDGVDLDEAANFIAKRLLANQGQVCSVGSRLLVQRTVEKALLARIIAGVKQIVIGDARDSKTSFGPLASAGQCARVMEFVESAADNGAELVVGGRRVLEETGGYFVEPTVFREVSPSARIAQEEIFGPVLSVIPFDDEVQAVKIANGTVYGLTAYVWTANLSTSMRMGKAIRSSVRLNATAPKGEAAGYMPSYEATGQSGFGVEAGLAGMESYLRRKLLWVSHA